VPAVFVHGSPETSDVWSALCSRLDRSDNVPVALPGFGCLRPDGFGSTKDEYVNWLIGELERLGEPVDLVGHDWGGLLTLRVASLRSDLLRSWASDLLAFLDERYEWHERARVYQTPGAGEEALQARMATPVGDVAAGFKTMGGGDPLPDDAALALAGWMDPRMAESMLALYRSAADLPAAWGSGLERISAPGLSIHATADPFVDADFAGRVAERVGARTARLEGLGHWWMLQDPVQTARVLTEFWASLT
jgi:pimeloyl-ACP methyl ester carboxylesterase